MADLDNDKLVALVQSRPALYDYKLKEYSNKEVIDHLWNDIAKEMDATGADCRLKWHNLRSSYARYLRHVKKQPKGSRINKNKKWHLADAMSFLGDYVNTRKAPGDAKRGEDGDKIELVITDKDTYDISDSYPESHPGSFKPTSSNQHCAQQSLAEVHVATPVAQFLESYSELPPKERESPIVSFFRGVLPDIERLAPRRQRMFKMGLVELVNKLVDEEEEDHRMSSTPSS